ncbi:MAG TPA: glycosyltransferase family 2 protein [Candidatus Saccharimonadales bacterium]|jgi:glycosyltransferase involved in cell wall biosynthesis|nr:glycosyltransferase family 2 protein [Candidatus Saccharimonadales bacterium]
MMPAQLLLITAIISALAALQNIVGVSLYDIEQVRLRRRQAAHPSARCYRRRPLVSIIITSENNQATIAACLNSLTKSRYRKWELIVADNASSDGTKRIVRQFMAEHPKKSIELYAKRLPADQRQLLSYAQKKYVHGELILRLNADNFIDKQTVAKAVLRFNSQPELDLLGFNHKIRRDLQTAGLLQEFGLLLRNRVKKAASACNTDYFAIPDSPTVYAKEAFAVLIKAGWPTSPLLSRGGGQLRAAYAADAPIYGPTLSFYGLAQQAYRQQLNRLRLLMTAPRQALSGGRSSYSKLTIWLGLAFAAVLNLTALTLPLFLTYFIYLAFSLHQPAFLVVSWMVLSLFMLFSIWDDEQLSLWQRLRYVGLMPISYGWFYLVLFIQYLALIASFRPSKFRT